MHYKNGRLAKVGDTIIHPKWANGKYHAAAGIVIAIHPGATTCNASVVPTDSPATSVTLGDSLHIDDADGKQDAKDAVVAKSAPIDQPAP